MKKTSGKAIVQRTIGVQAEATAIKRIEIRWPGSGTVQEFNGPIAADSIYEITEGQAALKKVDVPKGKQKTAAR